MESSDTQRFLVVGVVSSTDFQKCRYLVDRLHRGFPEEFSKPEIRSLLDVEFHEFITSYQRKQGHGSWAIKNKVIVFKNGEFLGDFDVLFKHIWKTKTIGFNANWHALAIKHTIDYLAEKVAACSGSNDIASIRLPSENYVVPHNRRGVLSMCNNGPHKENSTQFFVTFGPMPWMNYKFVAFGQLLQGDEIVKKLEALPTNYETPTDQVTIVKCGDFQTALQSSVYQEVLTQSQLDLAWNYMEADKEEILEYLRQTHEVTGDEFTQPTVCQEIVLLPKGSVFNDVKYKLGLYSLDTDLQTYKPFNHLPDYDPQDTEEC